MAFITTEDLRTHYYDEHANIITRDDDTIITAAIDGAIQEAKGYLGAYDREAVFAKVDQERNALLLIFVKDIAVWHFINLCNAGTELALRESRYNRAIDWLKSVQRGDVSPDLPKKEEPGKPTSGNIIFGSNAKKNQHF